MAGLASGILCLAAGMALLLAPVPSPAVPADAGALLDDTASSADAGIAVPDHGLGVPQPASTPSRAVQPAPPVRLRLPALNVNAVVDPVGVRRDGGMDVPEHPRRIGWWRGGALIGEQRGTTVLAGHLIDDDYGRGALYRLRELRIGARIFVDTAAGPAEYQVAARRTYRKRDLPNSVFARAGSHQLVLITCAGDYDAATKNYSANLVVYANPVGR